MALAGLQFGDTAHARLLDAAGIGLRPALPHAALARPMLDGGLAGEAGIEDADQRQRQAPERRQAIEAQDRLQTSPP